MISIIMPTLNASATIKRALDSINVQTGVDWELIVVDGGSSDNTVQQVEELVPDAKIILADGSGIYESQNLGLFASIGEWFYVMGADDELASPSILHDVWKKLHRTKQKFVYGKCIARGSYRWMRDGEAFGEEMTLPDLKQRGICQQSTFYHRDLFKKTGVFDMKYKVYADWDMAIRAFMAFEDEFMDITICIYNTTGKSSRERDRIFLHDLESKVVLF